MQLKVLQNGSSVPEEYGDETPGMPRITNKPSIGLASSKITGGYIPTTKQYDICHFRLTQRITLLN